MEFFTAALLGFMVAIPVGPVGLLILQRSLKVGPLGGLASSIGAALADGLFGFLAALGLVALVAGLEEFHHLIRPAGSLALMIVGLYFFIETPPPVETDEVLSPRYLQHYLWDAFSTFLLTLTNPATIIAFAALFAGSELIPVDPRRIDYLTIAGGVALGSFLWWMVLVVLAPPIKKVLTPRLEHRLLQIIGSILIGLAIFSFVGRLGSLIDNLRSLSRIPS